MASTVSVIIPCFNAARWIRETLESVRSQACGDLEVIAVDDGSTDNTAEIIRREFGFVNIVRTSNRGPGPARNLGTSLASGGFVQYLDADDLLAAEKIVRQLQLLEKSGADVAYGQWQWLVPSGSGFAHGRIAGGKMAQPELDLFDANSWFPTATYLFRKSVIDNIGGWNEILTLTEDERFVLDCAVHGAEFIYAPGVMAYYREVDGSTGQRDWITNRRCRYRNALDIEARWIARGGLNEGQQNAMTRCLGSLARACADTDRETFNAVLERLERLSPCYIPSHPLQLRLASKLLGYRRAENVAGWYRKAKRCIF